MRVAGLAAVIVLALVSVAPAGIASPGVASSQTPIGEAPPKTDTHVRGVNIPGCRVGGETVETAVVIPAIPFTDTGNTCPFVDNYDEMCPYDAVSPDCVYSYTATEDMFERTDHAATPWNLIAGDQKKWARIAVLETLIKRVEEGLEIWNDPHGGTS